MSLQTCMRERGRRRWEVQHTMISINLLSPPHSEISHRCAGITLWHNAQNNIPSSAIALQRLFQICSPHPAVCHWQGHRRLTSVLSRVAWGSWSAQLEIQQIYLDHEDKVVHLENDCDSVQPWCPLQLHRIARPGSVYWTRLNPQPRCFDSSSVRELYSLRWVESSFLDCIFGMNLFWFCFLNQDDQRTTEMNTTGLSLWN